MWRRKTSFESSVLSDKKETGTFVKEGAYRGEKGPGESFLRMLHQSWDLGKSKGRATQRRGEGWGFLQGEATVFPELRRILGRSWNWEKTNWMWDSRVRKKVEWNRKGRSLWIHPNSCKDKIPFYYILSTLRNLWKVLNRQMRTDLYFQKVVCCQETMEGSKRRRPSARSFCQ